MITGLNVTVLGSEVMELADKRADYHEECVVTYADQIASMKAAQLEGMNYSGGDPVSALEARRAQHEADATELRFIATHVELSEKYLLSRTDLARLGIVKDRY